MAGLVYNGMGRQRFYWNRTAVQDLHLHGCKMGEGAYLVYLHTFWLPSLVIVDTHVVIHDILLFMIISTTIAHNISLLCYSSHIMFYLLLDNLYEP